MPATVKCPKCNQLWNTLPGTMNYCNHMGVCPMIAEMKKVTDDPINHPKHYNSHPSGIECITITEHMGFNLGNAIKYIWRADEKGSAVDDLRKAEWYIKREIEKRTKA